MSWVPLKMRFPGRCTECGEQIAAGEPGLWLKGTGVKHERCGPSAAAAAAGSGDVRQGAELRCLVCGRPAGCAACEFSDTCDTEAVSQLCMCYKCMDDKDTYGLYRAAASRKFPDLEPRAPEGVGDAGAGGAGSGEEEGAPRAAASASAAAKKADSGGPRRGAAGGQAKLAQGQLKEVSIGDGQSRKRRGAAPGQQRL